MYYIIYKITNKLDGKFYIGKHKTKDLDDGYMGSGKLIKRAIKKYGVENFEKEVLHVFETEAEMNEAEARLVVLGEDSYNLCPGGHGGFGYINENVDLRVAKNRLARSVANQNGALEKAAIALREKFECREWVEAVVNKRSQTLIERYGKSTTTGFTGKEHSAETKEKVSKKLKTLSSGSNNSQFGTMWITDGHVNKKVRSSSAIDEGWRRGRISKLV